MNETARLRVYLSTQTGEFSVHDYPQIHDCSGILHKMMQRGEVKHEGWNTRGANRPVKTYTVAKLGHLPRSGGRKPEKTQINMDGWKEIYPEFFTPPGFKVKATGKYFADME